MASFVRLYRGTLKSIFDTETTIQFRVTQEDKEAFDSFNQGYVHAEAYVLVSFEEPISPNYQLPIQTTIEDATPLDEAYCYRCSERKQDAIQAEVWFKSGKTKETRTVCRDCAEKLMECKEHALNQVSSSKIAEKIM